MSAPQGVILAVDPGSSKCGLAAVTASGEVVRLEVVERAVVARVVAEVVAQHPVARLLVGDGTGGRQVLAELREACPEVEAELVDEGMSSLRARYLYFALNPPRGLWRLVPRGLLAPPRPVDDYAALVLAHEWLGRREGGEDGRASGVWLP